jgi:hypothetical protein
MMNQGATVDAINENFHHISDQVELELNLRVRDPEVLMELRCRDQGERETYALSALRVGVLAVRQASGTVDVERIKAEGERLIDGVRGTLSDHSSLVTGKIGRVIAQYFDPNTGNLTQRLERLISKDGDLENVLARYLDGEASLLARTLSEFVGEESPIIQHLSSAEADGFLSKMRAAVEESLKLERERLTSQFSLDDRNSALSRLVAEITDGNGRLRNDLAQDIETVRKEFSLDQPDGALSRLVKQVQDTTAEVRNNLTLDLEESPMARLRRELLEVINSVKTANTEFQAEVRSKLAEMTARREQSDRSTLHGLDFEHAVGRFLSDQANRNSDLLESTGNKAGRRQRCKLGDYVITLGPDSAAPGVRIVLEAKDNKSYDPKTASEEIAEARDNRGAEIGVFIFSKTSAPETLAPLARFGNDIIAVWDRDDSSSDPILVAAVSLARALAIKKHSDSERVEADFSQIDDAIRRVGKAAEVLSDIMTMAGTVRANGDKIRNNAEKLRAEIETQLATLNEHLGALRERPSQDCPE